ncbi:malectin domain-containing carbohydrate-binding protein [Bacteroidota bacterium]
MMKLILKHFVSALSMVLFVFSLHAQQPKGYTWQDTSSVDFGAGANHFTIKAATAGLGGEVALRIDAADGPLIGHAFFHQTGSTTYFLDYECDLYQTVSGIHDVYMSFLDYSDPITEKVLKVGDYQFTMVNDAPVTTEGNLHIYPPVPGLDPSPYYEIRIQKVSELNSGNLADVTNWETPFAWFTQCRKDEKGYYYEFGIGGWSHTYTNFELDPNTPIVVKITRKDDTGDNAPSGPITSAAVAPEHNIDSWEIIDGEVYVTMSNPAQVVIDIDRRMSDRNAPRTQPDGWSFPLSNVADGSHAVSIFANPFIEDKPNPEDSNVFVVEAGKKIPDNLDQVSEDIIYFEPGIHKTSVDINAQGELVERYWENIDIIHLGNNKSYYIPGNAIVYGNMRSDNGENIRVYGHGVLSGLKIMHMDAFKEIGIDNDGWNLRGIVIENANNCHVDGITMDNHASHTFGFHAGESVDKASSVSWVKVIGWRANTDGLSASGNLIAEDCFFRCQDDGLYIGGAKPMRRCIFWHDVNGQTFRGDFMTERIREDYHPSMPQQLVAEDIDIIFERAVFSTGDNGSGIIGVNGGSSNQELPDGTENTGQMVLFRNMRISDPLPQRNLLSFNVQDKKDDYAGLRFENIDFESMQAFGWSDHLVGSSEAALRNFVFDNVTYAGQKMDAYYLNDPELCNAIHVYDFTFRLRDTIPTTDYVLIRTATNGSISLENGAGGEVTVTAIPSSGYKFTGWSGDLSGSDSIATITMDDHKAITANFKLISYTITATSSNGAIVLDPEQPWYLPGTEVSILAVGDLGYAFDAWGGDLSGTDNPIVVSMDNDLSISASYVSVPTHEVTTTVDHGSIILDPPGGEYSEGVEITVTYKKDFGYQLDQWSGDLSGSENPQTLIVDADKDITALTKFTGDAITSYAINCGGQAYEASDGTNFTKDMNFSGGNTYSTSSSISGTDDPSLYQTERYGDLVYSFDLTNGEYTVTLMFAEIYADNPGARIFDVLIDDEKVIDTLDIYAEVGKNAAYFASFNVSVNDGGLNIELQTIRDNAKISAIKIMPVFEGSTYTLTTESTNGTILTEPSGTVFMENTIVTLEAVPEGGYTFTEWTGDLSGTENPTSITMDQDKSVTAEIAAIPVYELNVESTNGTVNLDPAGSSYFEGTVVTLTAVPDENYEFTEWAGDMSGMDNPYTLTMMADMNITATFSELTGIDDLRRDLSDKSILLQNYPNPFSSWTIIPYELSKASHVRLTVYNFLGEALTVLVDEYQSAGSYKVEWKGTDNMDNPLANGIYFYRMEADNLSVLFRKTIITR